MFKRLFATVLSALLALMAASAFAAVDVNKASQAELETVKGIGPALSGRILDERKKSGFKDWDDLVGRVKGVGPGSAAKFSAEGLTVDGQGYKGAAKAGKPAAAASGPAPKGDKKAAKAEGGASAAKK